MGFRSLAIVAALSSVSLAATPSGFQPASEFSLVVTFGDTTAMNGENIPKAVAQSEPSIGTLSKLDGTSFAVLMIDLDIPTDEPPLTDTLLHWMQTGLTQSSTAVELGGVSAFPLTATTGENAIVDYFGPNPPAKVPLSHRYTQILVDTSMASIESMTILQKAALESQSGFDAAAVLEDAGLSGSVVAGNYFVVTNTGPGTAVSNNRTSPFASGSGTMGLPGATGNPIPITPGAAVRDRVSSSLLGLAIVAALCACL